MCLLPGKAVPEMTYTVSGGTLNPKPYKLTHSFLVIIIVKAKGTCSAVSK